MTFHYYILQVNINSFNWDEARKEACANQSRVSAMARLFSSLHFNIGRLLDDPIDHLLSVSFILVILNSPYFIFVTIFFCFFLVDEG